MDYKELETYKFSVEELGTDFESFTVLQPYEKDVYDIVEEAARLFYYGRGGWQEAWPLTFNICTVRGSYVVRASVFILCATPVFDVVIL